MLCSSLTRQRTSLTLPRWCITTELVTVLDFPLPSQPQRWFCRCVYFFLFTVLTFYFLFEFSWCCWCKYLNISTLLLFVHVCMHPHNTVGIVRHTCCGFVSNTTLHLNVMIFCLVVLICLLILDLQMSTHIVITVVINVFQKLYGSNPSLSLFYPSPYPFLSSLISSFHLGVLGVI